MDSNFATKNRERIAKALRHEEPDQVPIYLNVGGPFFASYSGLHLYDYYHDPAKRLEAQLKVYDRFYKLTSISPDMGIANEPSALGAPIKWSSDGIAWVISCIENEDDIQRLQTPDLETVGYTRYSLQTYRFLQQAVGGRLPVSFNTVHSPWGVAALMRGVTNIMEDLILRPNLVHSLLRKTTDLVISWLRKMKSEVPEGTFQHILIWDDLSSFVGPKLFRQFILPVYQEVYGSFPQVDRWYHNDANATLILEGIADAGIQCFHLGDEVDIREAKRRIGDRVCLMGNVPPLKVLRYGTPKEVMETCRSIMDKAAEGGGLILGAGGYIVEGTPPENLDAMIEAAEKYGKY